MLDILCIQNEYVFGTYWGKQCNGFIVSNWSIKMPFYIGVEKDMTSVKKVCEKNSFKLNIWFHTYIISVK